MKIGIRINWCSSSTTGREFPVAVFSADNDMVTSGLFSLTSVEKQEVVIAKLTAEEYNAGKDGMIKFEDRINRELGRTDLRFTCIVRSEESVKAKGLNFKRFAKCHKLPTLFYRDIYDRPGEATVVREETEDAFVSSGGRILKLQEV